MLVKASVSKRKGRQNQMNNQPKNKHVIGILGGNNISNELKQHLALDNQMQEAVESSPQF